LNEEVKSNVTLKKEVAQSSVKSIVAEETSTLADTQKAKVQSLAEGIAYTDVDDFKAKLKIIVESFTDTTKAGNSEKMTTDAVPLNEENKKVVSDDPLVAHLAKYIGRSIKK
jgi:hypothetical protein